MKIRGILSIGVVLIVLLTSVTGISLAQDEIPEARAFIGIQFDRGLDAVTVTRILPNSPADDAGLEVDDIITAIDGEIVTRDTIAEAISSYSPNDIATLSVSRDEEEIEIEITFGEAPQSNRPIRDNFPFFGSDEFGIEFDGEVATVTELSEDNPLYEAGLRQGDIITAVNGDDLSQLESAFEFNADDTLTLTVERDDELLDIDVPAEFAPMFLIGMLSQRPFDFGSGQLFPNRPITPDNFGGNRILLGVQFVTLDEQTALQYDTELTDGAYITNILPNSPAEFAGLQAGDVVLTVDGDIVDFERTLSDRIFAYESGDMITLTVQRGDEIIEIDVTLGMTPEQTDLMTLF